MTDVTRHEPTQAQIDYIKMLLTERMVTDAALERFRKMAREDGLVGCRAVIAELVLLPRISHLNAAPTKNPQELLGMHKVGGDIYKVQYNQLKTRLYAKQMRIYGTANTVRFQHVPGAMSLLSKDTRMSMEEAKAFGAMYGTCAACGRTLSDPISVAAGVGPICVKHFVP